MCFLFAARPYHTDDPGTTEQGKFELETAVDYWNNSMSPGIIFKHGLTERMELDIPIGYNNLSGTYTFFEKLETGAEIGGTQESLNWWQIGAKYFFTDWFAFDSGIGGDFEKKMNLTATTGLRFTFPIKKEKGK